MKRHLYPICLDVAGRTCVVMGGGAIALEKVLGLVAAGARVVVVSPRFVPEFDTVAIHQKRVRLFEPADLDGAALGIAATDNAEANRGFVEACHARGIWCNVADDPAHCDFINTAVVRRGDLQLAVSTSGASPALAKRLRQDLDDLLDPDLAEYVAFLRQARERAKATVASRARRAEIAAALASKDGYARFRALTPEERKTWVKDLLTEEMEIE